MGILLSASPALNPDLCAEPAGHRVLQMLIQNDCLSWAVSAWTEIDEKRINLQGLQLFH